MLSEIADDARISQDQRLELQAKLISFVKETLIYDEGYVVFEVKDLGSFEFDFYYSSGSEIKVSYEETRDETTNRILFTLDCAALHRNKKARDNLNHIINYLYNYIVGFISANILYEKYGVKDFSYLFKDLIEEQS